jgi:hypothetical protein
VLTLYAERLLDWCGDKTNDAGIHSEDGGWIDLREHGLYVRQAVYNRLPLIERG